SISWEDLMPKDWNPIKQLQDANPTFTEDSPQAMEAMREIWDRAPTVPALDGAAVRLPGYVVPLEQAQGEIREFLLVPYFGACIHSPPPPANQIVHVVSGKPPAGMKTMDVVWVSGTLQGKREASWMGVSGYAMRAAVIEPYVRPERK
ncbi:MAG TPA: DUF3299 domain-containing protein, partial [Myxococcota bacterium]|nr:DUF3299 domain-containing protein [Myxococcota bacterium]